MQKKFKFCATLWARTTSKQSKPTRVNFTKCFTAEVKNLNKSKHFETIEACSTFYAVFYYSRSTKSEQTKTLQTVETCSTSIYAVFICKRSSKICATQTTPNNRSQQYILRSVYLSFWDAHILPTIPLNFNKKTLLTELFGVSFFRLLDIREKKDRQDVDTGL